MKRLKIDIKDLGMIRRRMGADEITLEELINFVYEIIAKNIRLEERIEELTKGE